MPSHSFVSFCIPNKIESEKQLQCENQHEQYAKPNIIAKLYCGQPGTGKSTLLRKLYGQYHAYANNAYAGGGNANANANAQMQQVILCPTNQLISTYQEQYQENQITTTNEPYHLNVQTLYHLLKLTPKNIPSKHLKNFEPLHKNKIQIPTRIYIDEIFMFSFQEMWALLKCIQIKQFAQKILPSNQPIEIYMFGDPFQLKCTATSIAQQKSTKQGHNSEPIYWYHAFKDFDIDIETQQLRKLYRFDEAFGKYITSLKESWREQVLGQTISQTVATQKPKSQKLPFDVINVDSLKKYISQGYVVLVGTHKARTLYQQKIFQQFKASVIYAKDGKRYRLNGPVYTLSEIGQSFQKRYTLQYYNASNGEFVLKDDANNNAPNNTSTTNNTSTNTIIIKPRYKNKTSYLIAPGDVLTVNVVQGRELPGVIVDMQSLFEFGSFYTAISRCKKIQDIKLITVAQMQYPDLQNEFVLAELLQDDGCDDSGCKEDVQEQEDSKNISKEEQEYLQEQSEQSYQTSENE